MSGRRTRTRKNAPTAEVVPTGVVTVCCGGHRPGDCIPPCCQDCVGWTAVRKATQSAVDLAVLDYSGHHPVPA